MKRLRRAFAVCAALLLLSNLYISSNMQGEQVGKYSTIDTAKLKPQTIEATTDGETITNLYAKEAILMDGDTQSQIGRASCRERV